MLIETFQQNPYEPAETTGFKETTLKMFQTAVLAGTVLSSTFCNTSAVYHPFKPVTYQSGYFQQEAGDISLNEASVWEVLKAYNFKSSDSIKIASYIAFIPEALIFLTGIAPIIETIYPGKGKTKRLNIVEDLDTGQPLLVLTFKSGFPINEEFIEKDKMIFDKIRNSGLAPYLQFVAFSNC
jgi:hypothetical protein